MSFSNGRFRVGNTPSPAAGGADDPSQGRFRASLTPAPATPAIPIVAPTTGERIGSPFAARETLLQWDLVPPGASPPPGKLFAPVDTDWSWRWRKHAPVLVPEPGGIPYISYTSDGVLVEQEAIPSGGGSFIGDATPYMTMPSNNGLLVDKLASPIWTITVAWDTQGPVQNDGTAPARTSAAALAPAVPTITKQPIIGDDFTDGPWLLYLRWDAEWIGGPGAWSLELTERVVLSYGGSGGPTTTLEFAGAPGGSIAVELDNTHNRIRCSLNPSLQIDTIAGDPGGWPANHVFGGSNMSPSFAPSFRHLHGHFTSVTVVPLTLEETVELLSTRSLVPGTGAPNAMIRYRAEPVARSALSARLSTYNQYWPLDDAASPMVDLVSGAYLTVENDTHATFEVDGIVNPLAPGHTKGLRLDRATDAWGATRAYLEWGGAGPVPSLGAGAAGDDITIGCWINWEGPPPDTDGLGLSIVKGSLVPDGAANVPSIQAMITHDAEPYGVELETFESASLTFKKLDTPSFDWPAKYALDFGDPLLPYVDPIPYKAGTWAQLVLVMRTVGGHMTLETWMDGVLVASGPGSDTGWGVGVALYQVAQNLAPCTIQHLTIWPFALTADEIAGIAAAT